MATSVGRHRSDKPSSKEGYSWLRLGLLALYLVPLAYIGCILAVAIHEILGHGLAALVFGGRFGGFTLCWDGMGWASASPPASAPSWQSIFFLAAGVGATTIGGAVFLVLALVVRRRLFVRLLLLVFSVNCLLEGPPYIFWNAYHPVGTGDIGAILSLGGAGETRWLLMAFGGIVTLGSTVLLSALLYQGVEEWVGRGERLSRWKRAAVLAIFIAFPGTAGWFVFDWDQLAPGLGLLPCVVGALTYVATATGLYWVSFRPSDSECPARAWPWIATAWGVCLALVVAMLFWLSRGVYWA